MTTINTILIDDEEKSCIYHQSLLQRHCPQIQILGTAHSIEDAYFKISSLKPSLVFLDIEMPPYSGFDLLKKFDVVPFDVIFVTAYQQYAINAIKFSALDYLLKPVSSDELITAVKKVEQKIDHNHVRYNFLKQIVEEPTIKKIILRTHQGVSIIELEKIIFVQADGAYSHFILSNGERITASKNIQEYEELLSARGFFRSHKSYLINLKHVISSRNSDLTEINLSNNLTVPLATRRKDAFLTIISK
jgi:two-component system LytT family response regulator